MNINALTVCVNYSDLLLYGVERWRKYFTSWTIVTDTKDTETAAFARLNGCRLHKTDVFYKDGASFNKGAAMEEARKEMPFFDWVLFLDADVVPDPRWHEAVVQYPLDRNTLYSVRRRECATPDMIDNPNAPFARGDGVGVGFFQLFHATDPVLYGVPMIETDWVHAGCYDSSFLHRWPAYRRKLLPFVVYHCGERNNWFGRGAHEAFATMQKLRRERRGYQHERIGVYPVHQQPRG